MIRGGELGEETETVAVRSHGPSCGACSGKAEPDPGKGMTIFNVHPDCVHNWPCMIVPGGNRLLTSIPTRWENSVLISVYALGGSDLSLVNSFGDLTIFRRSF
jgi:hypothetical protein